MIRVLALVVLGVLLSACAPGAGSIELAGRRFDVEVAGSYFSRTHGLMGRAAVPAGHGMLFMFRGVAPRSFWMKDTLVPLDLLFFDAGGRLLEVLRDLPPCVADPCPRYVGPPAHAALELPAGAAAGIEPGSLMVFVGRSG